MSGPVAALLGVLLGIGFFAAVVGFTRKPVTDKPPLRLKDFKAKGSQSAQRTDEVVRIVLSLLLGVGAWVVTGWYAAVLLAMMAGWAGPQIARAPKQRRDDIDEIEAYSQWTEQIRDLVGASGSLFEAVTLSADNAPARLRPSVMNMAAMARTRGLPAAMDWFASEMRSPYADRLVLGLSIAWDSGARVTEAFDNVARAMRTEVEMRRRNEVANSRAWTQIVSILMVTLGVVALLSVVNRGYFAPFSTTTGQVVLIGVGVLMASSILWVLKLSESSVPIRLLKLDDDDEKTASGNGEARDPRESAGRGRADNEATAPVRRS